MVQIDEQLLAKANEFVESYRERKVEIDEMLQPVREAFYSHVGHNGDKTTIKKALDAVADKLQEYGFKKSVADVLCDKLGRNISKHQVFHWLMGIAEPPPDWTLDTNPDAKSWTDPNCHPWVRKMFGDYRAVNAIRRVEDRYASGMWVNNLLKSGEAKSVWAACKIVAEKQGVSPDTVKRRYNKYKKADIAAMEEDVKKAKKVGAVNKHPVISLGRPESVAQAMVRKMGADKAREVANLVLALANKQK